jgi:hypothetical protein
MRRLVLIVPWALIPIVLAGLAFWAYEITRSIPAVVAAAAPGDVVVTLGAGNAVTIAVGPFARSDMIELVATFFSRGNEDAKKRFSELLPQAKTITLTLKSAEK